VAESARQKPAESEAAREELTDVSRPVPSSGNEVGPVEVAHKAAALLFAKKAEDMVLLDLRNLSTVADYYLICTCHNEPQMRAMLNDVQRTLSREGIKSLRSEYMSGVRWAIIDYGDLIIHLFESQTRGFYSLERLWADAPSTRLKAEDYALATESDTDEDDDL
jgi:ribosome-associated protein